MGGAKGLPWPWPTFPRRALLTLGPASWGHPGTPGARPEQRGQQPLDGMYRVGMFPSRARAARDRAPSRGGLGRWEQPLSLFLKVLSTCHQLLSAHAGSRLADMGLHPQGRAQPSRVPGFVLVNVGELGFKTPWL